MDREGRYLLKMRLVTIVLMIGVVSLSVCCGLKVPFQGVTEVEYHEDRLVFSSVTEGSPLCVYLEVPRGLDKDVLLFQKTDWEYEGWLFYQNLWKCFYVSEKSEGKAPKNLVYPDKKVMAVWTEKDQLVFGGSVGEQEALIVTDPVYADRNRKLDGADINYTVVPVTLYLGKKMISGTGFYQHVAFAGKIRAPSSPTRIDFLKQGTFCYLWDRMGNFWYIECVHAAEGWTTFAATQDQRGGWREAYEVRLPPSGEGPFRAEAQDVKASWTVGIPGWRAEVTLSRITPEESVTGDGPVIEQGGENGSIRASLGRFADYRPLSGARWYMVKGALQTENEKRTVYGIVQSCCPKTR